MVETDRFTDIIRRTADALIKDYGSGKAVIGGINGPYDDPETPVRNLAHLAVIVSIEKTKFNKTEYIPILERIGENLIDLRDDNSLWIMRSKVSKDQCNGVIGHAWLNEGFLYLYSALKEEKYLRIAADVSKRHHFNQKIGLWERPTEKTIDYTLNHQLWYAATLSEINQYINDELFRTQLIRFLECLPKNLSINRDGRIRHSVALHLSTKENIKQKIKNAVSDIYEMQHKPSMAYKEEGYHVFNLMALARLYRSGERDNTFFKCQKFERAMMYLQSPAFEKGLDNRMIECDASLKNNITEPEEKRRNIYGYPYNVPGFELAFVNAVFPDLCPENLAAKFLKNQIEYIYDATTGRFGTSCHDKQTINYRIYEYYRFLEIVV